MTLTEAVKGILSDETYDDREEPPYDHGEEAVGGDTSYDQINAILGSSSTVAGAILTTSATGVGGAVAGLAVTAAGMYKTTEGILGIAGFYDIDEKIREGEPHLDSEEVDPLFSDQ